VIHESIYGSALNINTSWAAEQLPVDNTANSMLTIPFMLTGEMNVSVLFSSNHVVESLCWCRPTPLADYQDYHATLTTSPSLQNKIKCPLVRSRFIIRHVCAPGAFYGDSQATSGNHNVWADKQLQHDWRFAQSSEVFWQTT